MAKKHNDEWNANEAKIARILADFKAAGVQMTTVRTVEEYGWRSGNIHAVCGQMFDGNKNDRPLTNQGQVALLRIRAAIRTVMRLEVIRL